MHTPTRQSAILPTSIPSVAADTSVESEMDLHGAVKDILNTPRP